MVGNCGDRRDWRKTCRGGSFFFLSLSLLFAHAVFTGDLFLMSTGKTLVRILHNTSSTTTTPHRFCRILKIKLCFPDGFPGSTWRLYCLVGRNGREPYQTENNLFKQAFAWQMFEGCFIRMRLEYLMPSGYTPGWNYTRNLMERCFVALKIVNASFRNSKANNNDESRELTAQCFCKQTIVTAL